MPKFKILSIDCEFTSFDMIGGDLISLAAVEIFDDFTTGREYQGFLRPRATKYFSDQAQEIHGISYFKAITFPEPRETLINFLHFLSPLMSEFPLATMFWGSWNFDLRWIETCMKDNGLASSFFKAFSNNKEAHVSGLKMARRLLKNMPIPANLDADNTSNKGQYKLDNVARFYELEHSHHDSLSDARVSAQAYCKMMKGEKVWTGELL